MLGWEQAAAGPSAAGEHMRPQNTQRAVFLLPNIYLLGCEIFVIPNTPRTFFCVKCLGRSRQLSQAVPSLRGPCFPQRPLLRSPFIKKSQTACCCLTSCSHIPPRFPGHRQAPLPWSGKHQAPGDTSIQRKDTKEKRDQGSKAFLAGTQLPGSQQGKKVGSALCSRDTARPAGEGQIPQRGV